MNKVVAVDFESYYGDDLSVKRQGPVVYASLTDIFMVGIYSPGLQYVGPPQDAPWQEIAGAHWVSHNAGFDQAVFQAAVQRGLISATPPSRWSCTADLSAFVGVGRKLSEAVKNSFGVTLINQSEIAPEIEFGRMDLTPKCRPISRNIAWPTLNGATSFG